MKTITRFFAFMAAAGLVFTSCEKAEEFFYPSFEEVTLEERVDGEGNAYFFGRFDVTCAETASLKNVSVSYTYGDTTITLPEEDVDLSENKKYEWTLKFNVPTEVSGTRVSRINLTAEVRNGGTKSQSFDTPAPEQNPDEDLPTDRALTNPAAFTFTRTGSSAATGDPSMFGLKWTSNATRAVYSILQKDSATKLVQLKSSDWNDIKTHNALRDAIEAGTDMNEFAGVSADKSSDYDIVLGIQDGEVYYMLHITSANVSTATEGTTIVINGQFCE